MINYDAKFAPKQIVGHPYGADNGLFSPWKIAANSSNGDLYIVDKPNHTIHVLDKYRQYLRPFQCGADRESFAPQDIAVTDNNLVAASDTLHKRIVLFDLQGRMVSQITRDEGRFVFPVGVAYWRGRLYITDFRRVQVYDTVDGRFVQSFSHADVKCLWGIFVDDYGILVSDPLGNRIYSFSLHGRLLWKAGRRTDIDVLSKPCGLSRDPLGYVLVADNGNERVQVFTPEGAHIHSMIRVEGNPTDVIVQGDGSVVVCLQDYDGIVVY